MNNSNSVFRRAVATIVAASMLTVMMPQAGSAQWDDRSGELPGISGIKGAVILGTVIGGGLVLYGLLKKRGEYPLEIANKLEFEANSDTGSLLLTNRGTETVTLSELRFDKAGFGTTVTVPVRIEAGQTLKIVVEREMENGSQHKKAKLLLTALRAGGKSIDRIVAIRVAS